MYIDLLPFIPKKISGFDVVIKETLLGEPALFIYYRQNRTKPIYIRRFVKSEVLGSMLGQYQAEGTKNDKAQNRIEFGNKLIKEHIEFLKGLEEFGFKRKQITIHVQFQQGYEGSEISRDFENQTTFKIHSFSISKEQKGKYVFKTRITSTIANRIVISTIDNLRMDLANNNFSRIDSTFRDKFFAKLLTGDGTLDIRTNNREYDYPHVRIKIVDRIPEYLEDYAKIMHHLGFQPHIMEKHISVIAGCSLEKLLYLYKIRAFENTNNWKKLLLVIGLYLHGRRHKTYFRFLELPKEKRFTSLDIHAQYNVSLHAALEWLRNKEKEDLLISQKRLGKPVEFSLTKKAINFSNILYNWKKDYEELLEQYPLLSPLQILDKLKIKRKEVLIVT